MLPWIVLQSVELLVGTGLFVVYALAGTSFSFVQYLFFAISLVVASYFAYAVLSHYILMRRMSKHSSQVISSVMNGQCKAERATTVMTFVAMSTSQVTATRRRA